MPPSNNLLRVKLENCFPTPCEGLVWNCKRADITTIRKALDFVNWDFIFLNNTVHDQVLAFDQVQIKLLLTMYPTNISPLMTKIPADKVKNSTTKKSLFKQYVKNGKTEHDYQNFKFAKTKLLDYIMERKNEYNFQLSQSLNNPATSAKIHTALLKTFYSGKKIPLT